jgi:hypothetical protein
MRAWVPFHQRLDARRSSLVCPPRARQVRGGLVTYLGLTALLSGFRLGLLPTLLAVLGVLFMTLRWLAVGPPISNMPPLPWWDVPLRMLATTGLVLLLTGAATQLGPELSGLLSPFPVFASVLVAFTHRHAGSGAAQQLLRGVVIGSFALPPSSPW